MQELIKLCTYSQQSELKWNFIKQRQAIEKDHNRYGQQLTVTNALESRIICLMLDPPAPMMAPTAAFGTDSWFISFVGAQCGGCIGPPPPPYMPPP